MSALQDISNRLHSHTVPTILNLDPDDLPAKLRNKAKRRAAMMSSSYPSPEPSSCLNVASSSPVKEIPTCSTSYSLVSATSSDVVLPSSPPAHAIPVTPPSSSPKMNGDHGHVVLERSRPRLSLSASRSNKKRKIKSSTSPPIKEVYIAPKTVHVSIFPDQTLAIGRKPQALLSKLPSELTLSTAIPVTVPPQARHASRLHVLITLTTCSEVDEDNTNKGLATLKVLGQNGCILDDVKFVEYNSSHSWSVSNGDVFAIDLHGCKINISVDGIVSSKKLLSLSSKLLSSPPPQPPAPTKLIIQRPPLCEIAVDKPGSFAVVSSPLSEPKSSSSIYEDGQEIDLNEANCKENGEVVGDDNDEDDADEEDEADESIRQYEFFSDEEADFLSTSSSSSREATPTPYSHQNRKSLEPTSQQHVDIDEKTPMIKFQPCDEYLDDEDDPNRTEDEQPIPDTHMSIPEENINNPVGKETQSYKHVIEIDDVLFGHIASALVFHARSTVFTSEVGAAVAEAYRIPPQAVSSEHLEKALIAGPFGFIPNRGLKDAQGKPLESSWYYIPDKDSNSDRRATLEPFVKKVRTSQTTAKQYYFKRPSLKRKRN